jgi:hypothetical protein
MDPRTHLFGIRHHGPGSAASLMVALDALDPAMVLIEGASEAEPLAAYAALVGMSWPCGPRCRRPMIGLRSAACLR